MCLAWGRLPVRRFTGHPCPVFRFELCDWAARCRPNRQAGSLPHAAHTRPFRRAGGLKKAASAATGDGSRAGALETCRLICGINQSEFVKNFTNFLAKPRAVPVNL